MILDELVLENFGVYAGRQAVTLTPKGKKRRITVIGGLNGRGKTTFMDAVQLALYGTRARLSNREGLAYDTYISRARFRGAGAEEPCAVELTFSINDVNGSVSYRVRRSWKMAGKNFKEQLDVSRDGRRDRALSQTWSEHVEELLPLEISSLFFFDGEKIAALADPGQASQVISAAVTGLLGLGVIERLQRDLQVLEKRKQDEVLPEGESTELIELQSSAKRDEDLALAVSQRCAAEQNVVDRLSVELAAAEDRARIEGSSLFERRVELEGHRARAQFEVETAGAGLREIASGVLPMTLCSNLLEALAAQSSRAAGLEGPALIGLLEQRDLEVVAELGKELSEDIMSRIEQILRSDRAQRVVSSHATSYEPAISVTRAASSAMEQIELDAELVRNLLEDLSTSLDLVADYDRQLAGVPTEDAIGGVLEHRDQLRQDLAEASGRLGLLQEEAIKAEKELEATSAEYEKARRQLAMVQVQGKDAGRVLEHAALVRATLDLFKGEVRRRSIESIEAEVLRCFKKLIGKTLLAGLNLDPITCEPTLTTRSGQELHMERLSAAERQLFAVAMLWGLARVSGRQLPTIIDTPLGRLDSIHRETLTDRYFPQAADQVILLSTDKEIDAELAARLDPHTGRWYRIDYDEDREFSQVSEGYFFEEADHVA